MALFMVKCRLHLCGGLFRDHSIGLKGCFAVKLGHALLEICLLPVDFPAEFGSQLKPSWVIVSCDFGNPQEIFLRFMKSAGNVPAEFPAKNEKQSAVIFLANNP
jgi:hypothetical protein